MRQNEEYVVQSLELHLFFARIMKEHSFFLRAGFTPVDAAVGREAECFKEAFEGILCQAAALGDGVVSCRVLHSGEVFTEFTDCAEAQSVKFTGVSLNRDITAREARLSCGKGCRLTPTLCRQVHILNQNALRQLDGLIALKERILSRVLSCHMFTANYPLLIEHITREARLYREQVQALERQGNGNSQTLRQTELFWNQIMMEHAMFIRGLLDPTESTLIEAADTYAKEYAQLLAASCHAVDRTLPQDISASREETRKFRDFKAAGAKGIQDCGIRSIILPLLADHVLREANHYLRLLDDDPVSK